MINNIIRHNSRFLPGPGRLKALPIVLPMCSTIYPRLSVALHFLGCEVKITTSALKPHKTISISCTISLHASLLPLTTLKSHHSVAYYLLQSCYFKIVSCYALFFCQDLASRAWSDFLPSFLPSAKI